MTDTTTPSLDELRAVSELLRLGRELGYGITFTPIEDGWDVGYMQGMGGGDLALGPDLVTASRSAEMALRKLARGRS